MKKLFRVVLTLCGIVAGGVAGSYIATVTKSGEKLANFLTGTQSSNTAPREAPRTTFTQSAVPAAPMAALPQRVATETLAEARKKFKTQIVLPKSNEPLEKPPGKLFSLVNYPSAAGNLPAYLTPAPKDKTKKYPAIVWITGGDCNTIGDVWSRQPAANDQSASAYREAGIIMMYPSLRGGNMNPGNREGLYGEVDDVIAAAKYLMTLPHVDPKRIYLGGHSTGGTLALLTAETTNIFRTTFSFGPSSDGINHRFFGTIDFNKYDQKEALLRTPSEWLGSIGSRVFVIEGQGGNAYDLDELRKRSNNPLLTLILVPGADHFNLLAPMNKAIAQAILKDTGAEPQFNLSARDFVAR